MGTDTTVSIALIVAVTGCAITVMNYINSRKKDIIASASSDDDIKETLLKLSVKLDMICNTTNETRSDIKNMQGVVNDHEKRLSIVERDLQTLWQKQDKIVERIQDDEKELSRKVDKHE